MRPPEGPGPWLALRLHALPLSACPAAWRDRAVAVVLDADGRRVLASTPAAQARGLTPGLDRLSVQARAPEAWTLAPDPAAEAATLDALAQGLSAVGPGLHRGADGLLFALGPVLRLWGGRCGLRARLRAQLEPLGLAPLQPQLAMAPTALGAWWLASLPAGRLRRFLKRASMARGLDALPLHRLPELWIGGPLPRAGSLRQRQSGLVAQGQAWADAMGLDSLGALRALPREGLASRWGPALLQALDAAYAGALPHEPGWRPRPRWRWQGPGEAGLASARALEEALAPAWSSLDAWLRAEGEALLMLSMHLAFEPPVRGGVPPTRDLTLRLAQASADVAWMAQLAAEKLARLAWPGPLRRVKLAAEFTVASRPASLPLWAAPAGGAEARARLIDRWSARLGPEAVRRLAWRDDHRPERAQAWVPAQELGPGPEAPRRPAGLRPAWLIEPPQPLACDALGRPLHGGGPLCAVGTVERLEVGWFEGQGERRDYVCAEGPDHRLRWIYRTPPGPESPGGWFLQGWFG